MNADADLSPADLKRDPSLWGVFGMCLWFIPIEIGSFLLGAALATLLPIPRGLASLPSVALLLLVGLPLWIWLMYCYFHRHWRYQVRAGA